MRWPWVACRPGHLTHVPATRTPFHANISKLRILLYPSELTPEDEARIREDDAGVIWLGKM